MPTRSAPLPAVDLVHRSGPGDEFPFRCAGRDLPGYIEIVREGLGAKPEDADVILDGVADILDAMTEREHGPSGAALYALARFLRHARAIRDHLGKPADGWTIEAGKL